jgi:phosphate transport system permease protein
MRPRAGEAALRWGSRAAAALAGGVLLIVLFFVALGAAPALRTLGLASFFTDDSWNPRAGSFNLTPMLLASLLVTAGAMAVAGPVGVLSAVFARFYAPRPVAAVQRRIVELLAGVPSVIYGLWGLVVLVPLLGRIKAPGTSLLAGACVLAIMVLPTVALIADASLGAVRRELIHGAAALGMTRWHAVRAVAAPAARQGLGTALILGTGRALGETMAVLMVCGNVVQMPRSVFDPVRTLTANMALEMSFAMETHRSALFVSGLLLVVFVGGLVAAAEALGGRHRDA